MDDCEHAVNIETGILRTSKLKKMADAYDEMAAWCTCK